MRGDIAAIAKAINHSERKRAEMRRRLGRLLVEARDHPEMTLEEGRKVPGQEIPRQTANRLIREAGDEAAYNGVKAEENRALLERLKQNWRGS